MSLIYENPKYPKTTNIMSNYSPLDADNVPLIVETHPTCYTGQPYLTYIQFHSSSVLAIIDNVCNKHLHCYVLDLCQPAEIPEHLLLSAAERWYSGDRKAPLSTYLCERGMDGVLERVYRTFNVEYMTRIVGPLFTFPIHEVVVTRRKKRKPVVKKSTQ